MNKQKTLYDYFSKMPANNSSSKSSAAEKPKRSEGVDESFSKSATVQQLNSGTSQDFLCEASGSCKESPPVKSVNRCANFSMTETRIECVKKDIRSVLITSKHGYSLEKFLTTYKSLLGTRLPCDEFGYASDIDFLFSLPDVVKVQKVRNGKFQIYGVGNESTKHIQSLVSRQKDPKVKSNYKSNKNNSKFYYKVRKYSNNDKKKLYIPATLKKEILELMKNYPDGIEYSSLLLAYKNAYKKKLNLWWLSKIPQERFKKLASMIPQLDLKVIGNVEKLYLNLQIYGTNNNDVLESHFDQKHCNVVEKSSPSTSSKEFFTSQAMLSNENRQEPNISIIPKSVKCNFEKVLKHFPDGILAVDFPVLYEEMTNVPLDIHDLGFSNLWDIVDALPDICFYVEVPGSLKDVILAHRNFSKNVLKSLGPSPSKETHKPKKKLPDPRYVTKKVLYEVVPSNLPYTPAELPEDAKDKFIEVFVSSAKNPSLFWFQVQSKEAVLNFRELEEHMKSFYDQYSKDYKLKDADALIGSACAAFSSDDKHWYRALITALPDVQYARVFFVDYGTWENIPRSMLCYLRSYFFTIPIHAHEAKLSFVKPSNGFWSIEACERFLALCNAATVMLKIESVYDHTSSVILCNTSGSEDIYLNDTLVNEGFAEVDFMHSYSVYNSRLRGNVIKQNLENPMPDHHQITQEQIAQGESSSNEIDNAQALPRCSDFQEKYESKNSELQPGWLFNKPTVKESSVKRRSVKKVSLGDGCEVNIVVVYDEPYVSAGDMCYLFWPDKREDVLISRLKCQPRGENIPLLTICEKEFQELFLQCMKYSVKGFDGTPKERSLALYTLKDAMKILNIFGHPSSTVRKNLLKEIESFDCQDTIWEEFQEPSEDVLEYPIQRRKLCLYDLKIRKEVFRYRKLKLEEAMLEATNSVTANATLIKSIESMQMNDALRMQEIKNICSMFDIPSG